MGHRLSKIYTRTGDDGSTGLSDRSRISKHSPRMQAIGAIDETNSLIGVLVAELSPGDALGSMLTVIQHDLFDLGGELSIPGSAMIAAARVAWLEEQTDTLNACLLYTSDAADERSSEDLGGPRYIKKKTNKKKNTCR